MIPFFFILLGACFFSLLAGFFIPPVAFLEGARVFLMPVVFFYGALALPYGLMLVLALACGLMWDSLTVQMISVMIDGDPAVVPELAFGWSVAAYALIGSVVSGFKPLFLRGRWEIHCLLSGIGVLLLVLSEFLFLSLRRVALYEATGFVFNREIGWRIGGAGLLALLIAPVVYWLLGSCARLINYDPRMGASREGEG